MSWGQIASNPPTFQNGGDGHATLNLYYDTSKEDLLVQNLCIWEVPNTICTVIKDMEGKDTPYDVWFVACTWQLYYMDFYGVWVVPCISVI